MICYRGLYLKYQKVEKKIKRDTRKGSLWQPIHLCTCSCLPALSLDNKAKKENTSVSPGWAGWKKQTARQTEVKAQGICIKQSTTTLFSPLWTQMHIQFMLIRAIIPREKSLPFPLWCTHMFCKSFITTWKEALQRYVAVPFIALYKKLQRHQ